ncbi:MAG: hypothetical protein S0880_25700 [Actinomycetota bacterium]|nr:hypothetical protein [Actinomycetota bacterium]
MTRDPRHPLGRILGDLLVRPASASGTGPNRRIPFTVDPAHHIGPLDHLSLLNHPTVYTHLKSLLTPTRAEHEG